MIGQILHGARNAALPVIGRRLAVPSFEPDAVTLVMQPDHLGDILLSQPAVSLLRQSFPDDRLIALTGPWSVEIARLAWPVDDVIALDYPGFSRAGAGSIWEPYRQLGAERDRLLPLHARQAIVLRPDAWWAAWLGRLVARDVVGSADTRVTPFLTASAPLDDQVHAVERAYAIAARAVPGEAAPINWSTHPLSIPLPVDDDAVGAYRSFLDQRGIGDRYAVIHPGSGAPVKEWPVHRWRAVANALSAKGLSVVVTGSTSEVELAGRVATGLPGVASIAGETALQPLAAVLGGATLVLGCDSGPLHLAVATGVPTIHLFGPSDPARYGAWGDPRKHRVVRAGWSCPRCGDLGLDRGPGCGCMLAIRAAAVVDVAMELLRASIA